MVMPDATSMGMKYQFVLSGGEEGVTLCTVEVNNCCLQLYVDGMVMPDATSMGMKYQFVLSGGEEGVTLCAV